MQQDSSTKAAVHRFAINLTPFEDLVNVVNGCYNERNKLKTKLDRVFYFQSKLVCVFFYKEKIHVVFGQILNKQSILEKFSETKHTWLSRMLTCVITLVKQST